MIRSVEINTSKHEDGLMCIQCAEGIISTLSNLCLNQNGGSVQINSDMLGEALHGIDMLLIKGRKMIEKAVAREVKK